MKKAKSLLLATAAIGLAVCMTGCSFKDFVRGVVVKVVGTQEDDQEDEIPDIEAEAGSSFAFPEGFDTTGRLNSVVQDGTLYVSFNAISNKSTDYFVVAGSSISVTSFATTDAASNAQGYKIALWQLSEDETLSSYISGSTVYYTPGTESPEYGLYTYDGLTAGSKYKLVISYDKGANYITGGMMVTGIGSDELTTVEGAAST